MTAEQLTALIAQPYRHLSKFGYDFSNGLVLAWLSSGSPVQLEFDLETDEGADDWTFWWISGGKQNYPGIRDQIDRGILQALHLDHISAGSMPATLPFTPLLSVIYRHREDLSHLIDIDAPGGVDQLWRWWLSSGRTSLFDSDKRTMAAEREAFHQLDVADYRATGIPKPTALVMLAATSRGALPYTGTSAEIAALWEAFLSSEAKVFDLPDRGLPFVSIPDSMEAPNKSATTFLPPGLAVIAIGRPDLRAMLERKKDGPSNLVYWWLTFARGDFDDLRDEIDRSLLRSLHIDHLPGGTSKHEMVLTPLLTIILDRRPELLKLFYDADGGALAIWHWWLQTGRAELFGEPDWLIEAELRSLHRLDVRSFEQTGVVPPTMLVHILSGVSIAGRKPSAAQISADWREFIHRNGDSLQLPNGSMPCVSNGFPDRMSGRKLVFGEMFPEIFAVIYTARPDLQSAFDWRTDEGLVGLIFWWLDSGREMYPELRQVTDDKIFHSLHLQHFLVQPGARKDQLTPLLLMLWNRRDDLHEAFDVEAAEGMAGIWVWWFSVGREEIFGPRATTLELNGFDNELPHGLVAIFRDRPDLQAAFGRNKNGPSDLVYWWLTVARGDFDDLPEEIDRSLLRSLHIDHLPGDTTKHELALTPLLTIVRDRRPDLLRLFDEADDGVVALWHWWLEAGRAELFGQLDWLIEAELRSLHRLDMHSFEQTGVVPPTILVHIISGISIAGRRKPSTAQISADWREFIHRNGGVLHLPNGSMPSVSNGFPNRMTGKKLVFSEIFPEIFAVIYTTRPDIRGAFDWRTEQGLAGLVFWWLYSARQTYPELRHAGDLRDEIDRSLLRSLHIDHLPGAVTKHELALTPLLAIIRDRRPDLQQLFDGAEDGVLAIWHWWLDAGRAELFGQLDWLIEAELRSLHGLDLRSFEQTGVVPPTMLVHIMSGISIDTQRKPTAAQVSTDWREFVHRNGGALQLPNGSMPCISNGFPDRMSGKKLVFGEIFPEIFAVIYTARPDLQSAFDWRTEQGLVGLIFWWLDSGREMYPELRQATDDKIFDSLHLQYSPVQQHGEKGRLTPLLLMLWSRRDDLRAAFNVETAEGMAGIWVWWFSVGREEIFGPRAKTLELNRFDDELPNGLVTIFRDRPDLQAAFGRNKDGPSDLVYWWIALARRDFDDLRDEVDRSLLLSFHIDHLPGDTAKHQLALTPLLTIIRDRRPDLQQLSRDADDGVLALWHWWLDYGRAELFGQLDWLIEEELQFTRQLELYASGQGTVAFTEAAAVSSPTSSNGPGVRLVGYPKGEFGLGEDIRLLRAALGEAKIDNIVIDAPWPITARQSIDEPSVDASVANFDCDVMLYVMPPFDTVTLLTKVGPSAFSARRKVGFWQWELDRFPIAAKLTMHLIDEIWCHSEHTAKAFRAATDKPVIKVPLPVFVPEPKHVPRAFFDLPASSFVVFTSFDGASAIARKNPLAAILAFQRAFPDDGIDARLIVKAMNTQNDSLWRECLRKALTDNRIVIIDEVLDRNAYYELLRNCDVVLSLHRAEGFGRLMAEAMALGIPVIASRYSGNLDFMSDENSWLIDGELVPLFPGDYAFHQHQEWLEPDIVKAAQALRECAANPADRHRRAMSGMHTVLAKYNLETCGDVYSNLLNCSQTVIQAGSV